jgi:hypothetical protein
LRPGCRQLSPPLRVEWADTKGQEGSNNSDVKSLHVSNLPYDCTEDMLREAFEVHAPIERIALLDRKVQRQGEQNKKREYAFVHYEKRSTALRVLEVRFLGGRTCILLIRIRSLLSTHRFTCYAAIAASSVCSR